MNRRDFLKTTLGFAAGAATMALAGAGCVAPRVSPKALDPANGQPWRCSYCGHVTRSAADLSQTRCPRCRRKRLERISDADLQKYL